MSNKTRSFVVLALAGCLSLAPEIAEARTYRPAYRESPFGYRLRFGYSYGYYPFWYGSAVYGANPNAYGYGYSAYPVTEAPPPAPALVVSLGAEAQANSQGGALGGSFALEGARWGFNAQATGVLTAAGNGAGFVETTSLVNGYVTYALLADPRGRIRIEGGAASAFAPDLILVGPSFGVSGAVGVIGPFGLEAQIHGTPIPYREVDWSAGGTLAIGPVGLRAGWRQIYLNDMGLGGTGVHEDLFSGPYLGLGLSL